MLRTNTSFFFLYFVFLVCSQANSKTDIAIITNQEANKVDIIDLKDRKVASQILVGKKPAGIFVDSIDNTIYTSNPGSNNISQINLKTLDQKFLSAGKSPMGIQFDRAEKVLFVSNWFENQISVVNTLTKEIISKIDVGKFPAGMYLSDSNLLFVAIKGENKLIVINSKSLEIVKKINVGKAPYGVFSSFETELLFVTNVQSNSVSIINKKTLKLIEEIDVGSWPYQTAFNKNTKLLYVTNQRDNSISIIDTKERIMIKTISDVCEYPEGIDISYNENLIVVACWFEDNIILLDLKNYDLIKKIEVSGGPRSFGKFILEDYE